MGLFGFGPRGTPRYRMIRPANHVPEALSTEVRGALVEGRLPCRAAWELGRRHRLTRRRMGDVLEALGIKVKPCQLGHF